LWNVRFVKGVVCRCTSLMGIFALIVGQRRMSKMCGFIPYVCDTKGCDSWVTVVGCLNCQSEVIVDE